MSQNKNEESGEGWRFPKEILPDLDSSFLRSKISAGGSKIMLPPAHMIIHKNEELRSGSISFGNLHPSPDSSFLLLKELANVPFSNLKF